MVIFPITKQDKRAYQWISDCTTNLGTNILFYEIYFIDEYGTRVDVKKTLQVNITLPKGYGVPKVAKISTNGSLSQLVSKAIAIKYSLPLIKEDTMPLYQRGLVVPLHIFFLKPAKRDKYLDCFVFVSE